MGIRRTDINWDVYRKFGANVRRERRRKGWTIEQLAVKSGITDRKLRRIEAGEIEVLIRLVIIFMTAINCTPARLLRGCNEALFAAKNGSVRARRAAPRTKTVKKRSAKKHKCRRKVGS